MKSLNRTLSLVLVLVMVFSLFGVAAATSFKDDTTIQYKEAVNVMTGIGAINGYTDGTFAPKGTITREEAAKMITYAVLGPTVAKTLSVTSTGFKDVAADRWSAPFISYCVSKGIINGMGDGTFAPTANVTAYQLAKMLLCAAGYGKQGEYTGASWSLNVAIDANRLYIFAGSKATSYSTAATREEAALYVFNMLTKVQKVAWSKNDELYKAANGGTLEVPATLANSFGKTIYTTLSNVADGYDMTGAPASVWKLGTKEISSVAAAPAFTFTATTSATAMTKTLKDYGYTAGLKDVTNGKTGSTVDDAGDIAALTGNGTVVNVYANTTTMKITAVTVLKYTFGTITVANTAATKTKGAFTSYTSGTASGVAFTSVVDADADVNTVKVTGTVANGDKVMLCQITNAVGDTNVCLFVNAITTVTGALTSITSDGTYTIGGTVYKFSSATSAVAPTAPSATSGTYYLDNYGYLVAAKSASGVTNMGLLVSKDTYSALVDGKIVTEYSAVVAKTDGTVETLKLDSASYSAGTFTAGKVITYTYDAANKVYGATAATVATDGTATVKVSQITDITTGSNTLTGSVAGAVLKYANANTKFIKVDYKTNTSGARVPAGTVTVYTGVAAVPSFTTLTAAFAVDTTIATNSDTVADVVYIFDDTAATATDKNIFVTGQYTLTANGYVFKTIVAGKESTLIIKDLTTSENASVVKGLFSAITVSAGVADVTAASGSVQAVVNNGGLLFAGTSIAAATSTGYSLPGTTPVYNIDTTELTCSTGTAADLATGYLCPTTAGTNQAGIYYVLGSGATANTVIAIYILHA